MSKMYFMPKDILEIYKDIIKCDKDCESDIFYKDYYALIPEEIYCDYPLAKFNVVIKFWCFFERHFEIYGYNLIYCRAVKNIYQTLTKLNLQDNNSSVDLTLEREAKVIDIFLDNLQNMSEFEVIKLARAIKKNELAKIIKIKDYPLALLLLYSIISNHDFDYEMFAPNTDILNEVKLSDMVHESLADYEIPEPSTNMKYIKEIKNGILTTIVSLSILATGGIINDELSVNHCEQVCLITKIEDSLGITNHKHQINKMVEGYRKLGIDASVSYQNDYHQSYEVVGESYRNKDRYLVKDENDNIMLMTDTSKYFQMVDGELKLFADDPESINGFVSKYQVEDEKDIVRILKMPEKNKNN